MCLIDCWQGWHIGLGGVETESKLDSRISMIRLALAGCLLAAVTLRTNVLSFCFLLLLLWQLRLELLTAVRCRTSGAPPPDRSRKTLALIAACVGFVDVVVLVIDGFLGIGESGDPTWAQAVRGIRWREQDTLGQAQSFAERFGADDCGRLRAFAAWSRSQPVSR